MPLISLLLQKSKCPDNLVITGNDNPLFQITKIMRGRRGFEQTQKYYGHTLYFDYKYFFVVFFRDPALLPFTPLRH